MPTTEDVLVRPTSSFLDHDVTTHPPLDGAILEPVRRVASTAQDRRAGDAAEASGDGGEFTEFVRRRAPALLRTAYQLTGDHGHAEDVLQTALAKVYVSWDRIRSRQAVDAYVRKTLVTTAMSWWRQRYRREEHLSGTELPDLGVPAGTDQVDERARVWRCVQALPKRQRAVIVLRYYEDLTEPETAAVLGCAVGTVKAHAHRAIAQLRQALDDHVPSERGDS